MKLQNKIKDWINRHKIKIQVERCWKESKPEKPKLHVRKINYDINYIDWFLIPKTTILMPCYCYDDFNGKTKPLEQYIEYNGLDSTGNVVVNGFMKTKN